MAVAASLNVNLTATSGQFTSTMTKAAGTMKKVGATASAVGGAVKGFIAIAAAKKAFNFVSHAVGDLEGLAKSAEKAGFTLSKMDRVKLGTAQVAADKLAGAFDMMKLQLVAGLAPAIQFTADLFTWFAKQTINGFSLMELAGKAVGAVIIVIGKGFQVAIKLIAKGLSVVAEGVAKISMAAAEVALKLGLVERASQFKGIADTAGKIASDLGAIDESIKWDEIFSWPEFKATANDIRSETKKLKELEAPQGIKLGSSADAIFSFKQKNTRVNAANNPQAAAANKQVGLLAKMERLLERIEQKTGQETVVTA